MQQNIDIITVTFNNLKELQRTYQSLLSQSDQQFCWIVIDGNSKDGTKQWLEAIRPPFAWRWLSEPDTGIYNAMNKGRNYIEHRGYSLYMNSGDELYGPDVIHKLRESLYFANITEKPMPLLIYGDAVNISQSGTEHLSCSRLPQHALKGMVTSHQAMLFNNQLLALVGYDERYQLSGDYDLMCKFIKACDFFNRPPLRLQIKICKFYLDGISVVQRQKALKEDYRIRRKVMEASHIMASVLFVSHQIHYLLKKILPELMFSLRSK
ncbi:MULTISPECIES: glycosyltransferase [unclassified Endozoicomonas]|uniref:glycosyltransferase n=1 Tax=unclassified Endozoicomonas TaxID=2644528 RepID=UPI003BB69672